MIYPAFQLVNPLCGGCWIWLETCQQVCFGAEIWPYAEICYRSNSLATPSLTTNTKLVLSGNMCLFLIWKGLSRIEVFRQDVRFVICRPSLRHFPQKGSIGYLNILLKISALIHQKLHFWQFIVVYFSTRVGAKKKEAIILWTFWDYS